MKKALLLTTVLGGKKKAAYTPLNLADLVCWYDATAITGLNDGDKVAQWSDLSTNALHVTQGTDAARPIYKVNIQNGKPAVFFVNDNNNVLVKTTGTPTVAQPYTVYAVFTAAAGRGPIGFGSLAGNSYISRSANWAMYAGTTVNNGVASSANAVILAAVFNGADSILRANGNAGTLSGNPGTGAIGTAINVGRAASLHDGYIMEIYVCNTGHTAAQLAAGEAYLSAKWGITLP